MRRARDGDGIRDGGNAKPDRPDGDDPPSPSLDDTPDPAGEGTASTADTGTPHRPDDESFDESSTPAVPGLPPVEPPPGADQLMWRLARRLFIDHRPDRDGFCVACREYWPCETREAADQGLEQAVRRRPMGNPGGRYRPAP